MLANVTIFLVIIFQKLGVAGNPAQNIVKLMGNAAGKGGNGIHFLSLLNLFLQPFLLGEVD